MKKRHIRKFFLEWQEKKLNPPKLAEIETHLRTCEKCSKYFSKMQLLLSEPELSSIPELQPDAFLPTRIREMAKQNEKGTKFFESWKMRFRLTLGTTMIIVALTVGVFLGKWMSGNGSISETQIVLSYSPMFSNQGVGDYWDGVVTEKNGEKQ